ncbi:hypothetical protein Dimus_037606, partial [Dionaea muscipula]
MYFRGQRIWSAAMEELMANGMRHANQDRGTPGDRVASKSIANCLMGDLFQDCQRATSRKEREAARQRVS